MVTVAPEMFGRVVEKGFCLTSQKANSFHRKLKELSMISMGTIDI
jgi:hypothetical protein